MLHHLPLRDTKTPSESPDGVLVSRPHRQRADRPKLAQASLLCARRSLADGPRGHRAVAPGQTGVNPHEKSFRVKKKPTHFVPKWNKAISRKWENAGVTDFLATLNRPGQAGKTKIHFVQKTNKVVLKKCDYAAMNGFSQQCGTTRNFPQPIFRPGKNVCRCGGGYPQKLQGLQFIGLKNCQNTGIHLVRKSHKVVPTI